MYTPQYIKKGNEYILYANDTELLRTEILAVALSIGSGHLDCTLHKHGNPKYVKNWYTKFVNEMEKHKHYDLASEIKYVASPNIPVVEINKMISHTGYLSPTIKGIIDE